MKASFASIISLGASSVLGASPTTLTSREAKLMPITVKGNAFFKGNDRFYIRGIDYQPGGTSQLVDPIADAKSCKRDIAKFKELGANTVRIYTVDNSKNHDECMDALADAGIYLVLDVNSDTYSINRENPKKSYNDVYLQNVFATIDMFARYPNTLAFFSGNEVVNDGVSSRAAPYVKAVTRDMRSYLNARNLRNVPVGYSAADVDTNRHQMALYMNCGSDDERSDFFAFNDYSWCDPSSFTQSAWSKKVKLFEGYGLPLFLSEYGCNTNERSFEEVETLYSTKMTGVYSGGLVYEYTNGVNNYGLVDIDGGSVHTRPDFDALKVAFSNTPNPKGDGGYNSTGGPNDCPAKESPNWEVDSSGGLPAIPEPALKYMKHGAGKGVGFSGKGSQEAGTQSTANSTASPSASSRKPVITCAGPGSSSSSSTSPTPSPSQETKPNAATSLTPLSLSTTPVIVGLVTALLTML